MNDRNDNARMYNFLLVLTIASTAGLQGWRTLINNFAVQVAALTGYQIGIVQSVREIPGLLALLVVYLLLLFSEHTVAALAVAILGLGVILTGISPTLEGITLATLVMSFGFHYYETINQSLTLQYFDIKRAPLVFARLRSLGAAVNILTGMVVFALSKFCSFPAMFAIIGGIVAAAGLWCLRSDPSDKKLRPQHRKMILRKRYWLFYALTLLAGARRQIFTTFAVFLLVDHFRFSVQAVTVLFVINNIINYFANPLIARAINRFGERKTLSLEYFSLIGIFLAYAYCKNGYLAAGLYILDNLFYNFSMAIRTYFQKIADTPDIAPSMAVGFTINHITAVIIPFIGGILWMLHYQIPFFAGAGLSFASLTLIQCMRTRARVPQTAGA